MPRFRERPKAQPLPAYSLSDSKRPAIGQAIRLNAPNTGSAKLIDHKREVYNVPDGAYCEVVSVSPSQATVNVKASWLAPDGTLHVDVPFDGVGVVHFSPFRGRPLKPGGDARQKQATSNAAADNAVATFMAGVTPEAKDAMLAMSRENTTRTTVSHNTHATGAHDMTDPNALAKQLADALTRPSFSEADVRRVVQNEIGNAGDTISKQVSAVVDGLLTPDNLRRGVETVLASLVSAAKGPEVSGEPKAVTITRQVLASPLVPFGFPDDKALALAAECRRTAEQDATMSSLTVGPRRMGTWKRLARAFVGMGRPLDEAVSFGYRMAFVDREYGATRDYLTQLFAVHFATPLPERVSLADACEASYKAGVFLWVHGPAGAGKTYGVREWCRTHLTDPVRYNASPLKTLEHLLGAFSLTEGEKGGTVTCWQDGPLPMSLRTGKPFLWDEFSANSPEVSLAANALLEDGTLTLDQNAGERLTPQQGWWLVATSNDTGQGENTQYAALRTQSEATRDRFGFVHMPYPTPQEEMAILATF